MRLLRESYHCAEDLQTGFVPGVARMRIAESPPRGPSSQGAAPGHHVQTSVCGDMRCLGWDIHVAVVRSQGHKATPPLTVLLQPPGSRSCAWDIHDTLIHAPWRVLLACLFVGPRALGLALVGLCFVSGTNTKHRGHRSSTSATQDERNQASNRSGGDDHANQRLPIA